MSEQVSKSQATENVELTEERLERVSGGGGRGNDLLIGGDGVDVTRASSGDADDRPTEEVAFYYNRVAFKYAKTVNG